jgi:hydroxyquinol 1,2-dioxygenase
VFGASGDLVAHERRDDADSPVPGLPSIRFDFSLSRESEVDRRGGRVGADPASIAVTAK